MGHQSSTHPSRATRLLVWAALALLFTRISTAQTITTTASPVLLPSAIVYDTIGNLYVAETGNHIIRKIDSQGHITTFAGTGAQGFSGDGGPATHACLDSPQGLALTDGTLYIADTHNHRIRRVDLATNLITTIAGTGIAGFSGDHGLASSATFSLPTALALDAQSNLYIADMGNHRIRRIDASGTITTIAGNGTQGYAGDSGPATDASIDSPAGLATDSLGNLYLADTHNQRIRKIDASTHSITTLAGTGDLGISADGTKATAARLALPQGLAADAVGDLYLADTANHRILRIDATSHALTVVAGTGTQSFSGDTGSAAAATLDSPRAAAFAPTAELTIADTHNNRVRQLSISSTLAPTVTTLSVLDPSATPISVSTQTTSMQSGVLTGTVTIVDAANPIATSALALTGAATIVLPVLDPGTHTFTATYSGDRSFHSSTSAPVVLTIPPVTTATADFTLTANSPNAQIIPAGTPATFNFTTQTQGALSSAITLSASGLPVGASATFSPSFLPPGSATGAFSLTITTLKPNAATNATAVLLPGALATLLLSLLGRRRLPLSYRCVPRLLSIAVLSLMTLTITACGDRIRKDDTQTSAPANYTITVTGTATSPTGTALVHTATVTLTLQ